MILIPAIDIKSGKCVRLYKGDFGRETVYADDPIEIASGFVEKGIKRLHIVDLDGAKEGKPANFRIIASIKNEFPEVTIETGGGIRDLSTVRMFIDSGIDYVIIGSMAYQDQEKTFEIVDMFGERIIIAADIDSKRRLAIKGWLEKVDVDILDYINRYFNRGVREFLITNIDRDGTLEGVDIELYRYILQNTDSYIIASGGVRDKEDIDKLSVLSDEYNNLIGCVVGKAIYEGKILL